MGEEMEGLFVNMTLEQAHRSDEPDYFRMLPDEMILRIFRCMPQHTLKYCASVCKRWRALVYKNADLNLGRKRDIRFSKLLYYLLLDIKGLLSNGQYVLGPTSWPFLDDYIQGKIFGLKRLELNECMISTKCFVFILDYAKQLEILTLRRCKFDGTTFLNAEVLFAIRERKLKSLHLIESGYMSICGLDLVRGLCSVDVRLLFKDSPRLEGLSLCYCGLEPSAAHELARVLPSSLRRLELVGLKELLWDHLAILINSAEHLEQLIFIRCRFEDIAYTSYTSGLTECFKAIGKKQNLKVLVLHDIIGPYDTQRIRLLFQDLSRLEELDLGRSVMNSEEVDLLVSLLPSSLRRLRLDYVRTLQNHHIAEIVRRCPKLVELTVRETSVTELSSDVRRKLTKWAVGFSDLYRGGSTSYTVADRWEAYFDTISEYHDEVDSDDDSDDDLVLF